MNTRALICGRDADGNIRVYDIGPNGEAVAYLQAVTSGGYIPWQTDDLDETPIAIKAARGQLYEFLMVNATDAVRWVHIFDRLPADVTLGVTPAVQKYRVPTLGDTNGAGIAVPISSIGMRFETGITIAATVNRDGTGALGDYEMSINAGYL